MYQSIDGPNLYANLAVTTTPVEVKVGASALEDRLAVLIQPQDGFIYMGYNSSVSSATGIKIFKGQLFALEAGSRVTVYIVSGSGTVNVRIQEVS